MFSSLQTYRTDRRVRIFGLFLMVLMLMSFAKAQNSEIGFESGGYQYLGDVTRSFRLKNHSIGAQFFVRKHLGQALSARWSLGAGRLKGADDEAFDVFSANRKASFRASFFNTDLLFEYHFLNYRSEKFRQYWTPYLLFGAGLYRFGGTDDLGNDYHLGIKLRLPVGIGIKYRLDRHWTLAISTSVIKSNSDLLDNVSGRTPYRGGNPHDDDWMFFTGVSLSYTLYRVVCPRLR